MSKDFLITEEEIMETILHSPYSMPNSPYEKGQGADEVKKYFYEFIRYLIAKLNLHLEKIQEEIVKQEETKQAIMDKQESHDLSELSHQALITGLREQINEARAQLDLHKSSLDAHPEIKELLSDTISSHEKDANAHKEIRELIKELSTVANNAYSISMKKSKIIPLTVIEDMLEYIDQNAVLCGDVFIFEEENVPDFTCFGSLESGDGLICLDYDSLALGEIEIKPGKVYFYNGIKLVASESGIDVSALARKDETEMATGELAEELSRVKVGVSQLEGEISMLERKKVYVNTSGEEITLRGNTEYDLGLKTSLKITLPDQLENGFYSVVNFRSGSEATLFEGDSKIYFSGDDCLSGVLYPISKRLYEINIKSVCSLVVAKVSAVDCEVI